MICDSAKFKLVTPEIQDHCIGDTYRVTVDKTIGLDGSIEHTALFFFKQDPLYSLHTY